MKRFMTLALVGALVLGASSIVYANVCAFDAVPAATILFPFVQLDYDNAMGNTTNFSITNVSSEAQIVHVTVWTDFSAAILDFNILLTGYDVISMNIRDILVTGQLPVTTFDDHESNEGVFANGPVSGANTLNGQWLNPGMAAPEPTDALDDRPIPCDATSPSYPGLYTTKIPIGYLNLFKGYLQVSQMVDRTQSDECDLPYEPGYDLSPKPFWAERTTADTTWMYVTADVVETCNKLFPDVEGYFANEIRYENVLVGDMGWINVEDRLSEYSNAVMIEASQNLDAVATTHPTSGFPISFYHRYAVLNEEVSDYREPLPTAWMFRYAGAGLTSIGTDVRVWKGSTNDPVTFDLERVGSSKVSPSSLVASNCHAYTYYAWDEDEMVTTVASVPWSAPGGGDVVPNLVPLEAQEIPIEQFDTPGAFGWMLFVWPASNYPDTLGTHFQDYYQTWMGVKYNAFGDWSAALDGAVMANFNCFSDQILPTLGIDYEYTDAAGYVVSPGN